MTRKLVIASTLSALVLGVFVLGAADAWAQAGPMGSSLQVFSGGPRWPAVSYDQGNRVYLVVFGASGVAVGSVGGAIHSALTIRPLSEPHTTPRSVG